MSSKTTKYAAAPLLVLGLASPIIMAGCGDSEGPLGGSCEVSLVAKAEALSAAVDGLIAVTGEIKANVGFACSSIAQDLGAMDAPVIPEGATDTSDDDIQAACSAASAAINAELEAGVEINVAISGGKCEVNAEAQLSCEASCDINGECTPGSVDVRCEPGKLSGSCSAECSGSCEVQGGSVDCAGGCSGTCEGMCNVNGTSTAVSGECAGTCEGSCSGTCEVVAPSATCSGTCTGECSAEFEAPSCTGEIEPPMCNLDADCQAGCDGQAKFEAQCTPPEIVLDIQGGASANLASTLEANLPILLQVATVQGPLVIDAAGEVATKFGDAAGAVTASLSCVAQLGADFAANVAGSVEASASVSVSVSASAEASGSATGGA